MISFVLTGIDITNRHDHLKYGIRKLKPGGICFIIKYDITWQSEYLNYIPISMKYI